MSKIVIGIILIDKLRKDKTMFIQTINQSTLQDREKRIDQRIKELEERMEKAFDFLEERQETNTYDGWGKRK